MTRDSRNFDLPGEGDAGRQPSSRISRATQRNHGASPPVTQTAFDHTHEHRQYVAWPEGGPRDLRIYSEEFQKSRADPMDERLISSVPQAGKA